MPAAAAAAVAVVLLAAVVVTAAGDVLCKAIRVCCVSCHSLFA